MKRTNKEIVALIELVREEGIESIYLKYSCKNLYNKYKPIQIYDLDLTSVSTKDYKQFNPFWCKLKKDLREEFRNIMTDRKSFSLRSSAIIRVTRTQCREEDFLQIEAEIENGGNSQSLTKVLMLPNIQMFMEDYETEQGSLLDLLRADSRTLGKLKGFKILEGLKTELNSTQEVVPKL